MDRRLLRSRSVRSGCGDEGDEEGAEVRETKVLPYGIRLAQNLKPSGRTSFDHSQFPVVSKHILNVEPLSLDRAKRKTPRRLRGVFGFKQEPSLTPTHPRFLSEQPIPRPFRQQPWRRRLKPRRPTRPLEEGAAILAGAATTALACDSLPGFLPGFFFLLIFLT